MPQQTKKEAVVVEEAQSDSVIGTTPELAADLIVPLQEDDPNDQTIQSILEGTLRVEKKTSGVEEPIKQVPAKQAENSLAKEQGRVIEPAVPAKSSHFLIKVLGILIGVGLLTAGVLLNWSSHEQAMPAVQPAIQEQPPAEPSAEQEEVPQVVSIAAEPEPTAEERAKEIVQNYVLDEKRGTVESYLMRRYAQQLAAGYSAHWLAEPLHRNVYVVEYRLSKTRQEPIVYIFQADIEKKKLTGALNNITLDLVGKLNS